MRILFDNNMRGPLRPSLSSHVVRTAQQVKWEQLKNGDLLRAAEAAGFDVLVTADQNIQYQQNLFERKISLVVLGSNLWPFVRNHIPEIVASVDAARTNLCVFHLK